MLIYKAMFKFCDDGVHAEVLDFPGAISCGLTLDEARKNLAGALVDMTNECLSRGETLPQPDPSLAADDADVHEPIDLIAAYVASTQAPSGVDTSLLKQNLKLTVTERWEQNERSAEFAAALEEAGRVQRSRAAQATR